MYDAVTNSAEVVAAVLGIAVTVVAIIVELAATRFNHRISTLFAREPLNIAILSFFVLTTLMCVWVSATTSETPSVLHAITMAMVTVALLALLPYFMYVFSFISPLNVIRRIKKQAHNLILRCADRYDDLTREKLARAVDELQDVLRSAIDSGDRDIAMACVDATAELLQEYSEARPTLPDEWFTMTPNLVRDPDFVSLEQHALERIDSTKTWFEFKVFSQLHAAVDLVIPRLRDVANLISIRTRDIATAPATDAAVVELCLTGFNSYLRTTLRGQDPRTAYYVLSQYRLTAEALLGGPHDAVVSQITRRLRYYAHLSYNTGQPFIMEVCAYDLVQLLERCLATNPVHVDVILDVLLELDLPFRSDEQAATVAGVRRAQIRAAAALLEIDDQARAQRVIQDLASESQLSVFDLVSELEAEQDAEYWELTPRGVNFSYLEPGKRSQLEAIRTTLARSL